MAAKPTNTVLVDVYDVLTDILAPATRTASSPSSASTGTNGSLASQASGGPSMGLPPPLEHAPDCRLLDRFAISVQVLMGALALSSLVYKRHREKPRRPLKIWSFDVSKQVLGQLIVHILNILVSLLVGGQGTSVYMGGDETDVDSASKHGSNPCVWYILNLLVDCTVGVGILYLFLWTISHLLARPPCNIRGILPFGNYAPEGVSQLEYPKQTRISFWAKQTGIYVVCLFLMKVCVVLLFEMIPSIFVVGHYILKWTEGDTRVQVAFVMLIFPLIMNIIQFWMIDTIIKAKTHLPATFSGQNGDIEPDNPAEGGTGTMSTSDPPAYERSTAHDKMAAILGRDKAKSSRTRSGESPEDSEYAALLDDDDAGEQAADRPALDQSHLPR